MTGLGVFQWKFKIQLGYRNRENRTFDFEDIREVNGAIPGPSWGRACRLHVIICLRTLKILGRRFEEVYKLDRTIGILRWLFVGPAHP